MNRDITTLPAEARQVERTPLKGKVVRLRWVKNYSKAHNHIAIGLVVDETPNYIRLHCRVYHFGPYAGGTRAVVQSDASLRIVPWSRVEVIHELGEKVRWNVKATFTDKGDCILMNEDRTHVTRRWDVDH